MAPVNYLVCSLFFVVEDFVWLMALIIMEKRLYLAGSPI